MYDVQQLKIVFGVQVGHELNYFKYIRKGFSLRFWRSSHLRIRELGQIFTIF